MHHIFYPSCFSCFMINYKFCYNIFRNWYSELLDVCNDHYSLHLHSFCWCQHLYFVVSKKSAVHFSFHSSQSWFSTLLKKNANMIHHEQTSNRIIPSRDKTKTSTSEFQKKKRLMNVQTKGCKTFWAAQMLLRSLYTVHII